MEIVQERLEREYALELVATAPSVAYRVALHDGSELEVSRPTDMPASSGREQVMEPWLNVSIVTPSRFVGGMMELVNARRGLFKRTEYLDTAVAAPSDTGMPSGDPRVLIEAQMPLAEVLVDFYDHVKTRSRGYASLDYAFDGYRQADLVRLDVLVNETPVDALSLITHREAAQRQGRELVVKLRSLIPRQMFDVPIQARHRLPRHRPRDGQGAAQERPRQMLRRRRYAQAQTPREAGGGQEAHEARRQRGRAARGVPRRAPHGALAGQGATPPAPLARRATRARRRGGRGGRGRPRRSP